MNENTIVLIGPIAAGKTTIGELLSQKLNLAWVQLDEIRFPYYEEIGYSEEVAKTHHDRDGVKGVIAYWKQFEVHSVERVLQDHQNCVIDFGAGHSVYEDEDKLERVKKALEPYPNVVLLLPSPDVEESQKILTERFYAEEPDAPPIIPELNQHFLTHHSNRELAKITVYTKDKTPEQTCDEIIGKLTR